MILDHHANARKIANALDDKTPTLTKSPTRSMTNLPRSQNRQRAR